MTKSNEEPTADPAYAWVYGLWLDVIDATVFSSGLSQDACRRWTLAFLKQHLDAIAPERYSVKQGGAA